MPKEKFDILESTCIPLPIENIDTDQIIPARFLSLTSREGFGEYLFRDWRFDKSGNKIEDCVFNNPRYSGRILVTGKNFGSGSSREHAVWAIAGYGFRAVVSSFFADIFRNNCLNNGILPVVVKEDYLQNLLKTIRDNPSTMARIDLDKQLFTVLPDGEGISFEINPYKKECLLNGLDDIDYLLSIQDAIKAYELRKTLGK
ncbi:MAG TPA: 3-isopropylmalate dehydratase small subunit [Bacteroidales bacterium]|jgi:3-isopropylmalate/(R)-2-methylmalate dehydratase small subunit|nr:3-isopropylmalate dehydratase small subunit [Bacteroidales bacterium]HOS71578.1 3-isopropylmalate dehydratase small subunit [Bacteroidales bacterium]HQH22728.1 3-isopropylmalate dehydratase small subunit [Bacteroidales bacterium]HQJ82112.1 3-isopropylmalate dehydratase small subunit [Bacteroidales bacterium]